jgi:hypothetical protein
MTYLRKIKVQLYNNVLAEDPNDYIARVVHEICIRIMIRNQYSSKNSKEANKDLSFFVRKYLL